MKESKNENKNKNGNPKNENKNKNENENSKDKENENNNENVTDFGEMDASGSGKNSEVCSECGKLLLEIVKRYVFPCLGSGKKPNKTC